jgi:hypothetical protein
MHQETLEQLPAPDRERRAMIAARARLLDQLTAVREGWSAETGAAGELPAVQRHVARALIRIETAILALGSARLDPVAASRDFEEAALPLVFLLRGMDTMPEAQVAAWRRPMEMSA